MSMPIQARSKSHRRRLGGPWTPGKFTPGGYSPAHWWRSDDAYQENTRVTPCTV